jgi:hypothetical protein
MYKVCKISDTCKRNAYVYGTPLVCHMFVIHVNCHIVSSIKKKQQRVKGFNLNKALNKQELANICRIYIDTIDFRVERLNKLNVKREIF